MLRATAQSVFGIIALVLLISLLTLCSPSPAQAQADIPHAAQQYRATLVRAAHAGLGLNAPVATLAAQVHQESRWQINAKSPAGAEGLAQFMPATSRWMPDIAPQLGTPQPYNPGWALRAMVAFDGWLLARTEPAAPQCENWAFTMSAYNGGLTWVRRDQTLASAKGADQRVYFDHVERHNAGRSAANFAENRHYVRVILTRWEALYAQAGWGRGVCENRWVI